MSVGDVEFSLTSSDTDDGRLGHLRPVVQMAGSPARWDGPTAALGTHRLAWLEPANI